MEDPKLSKSFLTRNRGILFMSSITITSLFGSSVLMGSVTPLAFTPWTLKYHRKLVDRVLGWWFTFVIAVCEYVIKMEFRVTGDPLTRGESCIYIMNHRTRLDWMWIWALLYHYSRVRKLKIIMKSPLKKVPGFGWACQQASFIFLDRCWQTDKKIMANALEYYFKVDAPVELLIFPEGTDLRRDSLDSSQRFALKNGLDPYQYVLHPRTTGFEFLVKELRKRNQIKTICDITVGYPANLVQDEADMTMKGNFPRHVHFHVEKYNINDIPINYQMDNGECDTVASWINNIWREKEDRLVKYYSGNGKFAENEVLTFNSRKFGLLASLVLWPVMTLIWLVLLCLNRNFLYYQIGITTFYIIQMIFFGGFEKLINQMGILMLSTPDEKEK